MRWTPQELWDETTHVVLEETILIDPATDTEVRWAWAAGLFDGEGCIVITDKVTARGTAYRVVKLQVSMTDRDVVENFAALVHANAPLAKQFEDHRKTQYRCTLYKADPVERALRGMLPYFGERRAAKAWEALEVLKENRDAGSRRLT